MNIDSGYEGSSPHLDVLLPPTDETQQEFEDIIAQLKAASFNTQFTGLEAAVPAWDQFKELRITCNKSQVDNSLETTPKVQLDVMFGVEGGVMIFLDYLHLTDDHPWAQQADPEVLLAERQAYLDDVIGKLDANIDTTTLDWVRSALGGTLSNDELKPYVVDGLLETSPFPVIDYTTRYFDVRSKNRSGIKAEWFESDDNSFIERNRIPTRSLFLLVEDGTSYIYETFHDGSQTLLIDRPGAQIEVISPDGDVRKLSGNRKRLEMRKRGADKICEDNLAELNTALKAAIDSGPA